MEETQRTTYMQGEKMPEAQRKMYMQGAKDILILNQDIMLSKYILMSMHKILEIQQMLRRLKDELGIVRNLTENLLQIMNK